MCRIAGIVDPLRQHRDLSEILERMRDSMAHGGPDDAGMYFDPDNHLALAHRRLAILDPSPLGHQPMADTDEQIWLTHNGEIYNFRELRSELQNLGYDFRTNTDTEVIIYAYRQWGECAFAKFTGMFAFALYDKGKNLLYLVRDHIGIKPLYYSYQRNILIFSSEVRAFKIVDRDWPENPDWQVLFLLFGYLPQPVTTLQDVEMLAPATFLRLDLASRKHSLHQYQQIKFSADIATEIEAQAVVHQSFTSAVRRHLVADVPVGVFLSGGIDSSLLALISAPLCRHPLRTLSITFAEASFSEEKYQRCIADKIQSHHCSYSVTERDFFDSFDDIIAAMDQPTIDGVNTYFVARCAKQAGLKTVLSGLGADELFGGYPSFARIDKIWFLRNSPLRKLFCCARYLGNSKWSRLSHLSLPRELGFYLLLRGIRTIRQVAQILGVSEWEVREILSTIAPTFPINTGKKNFVSLLETNLYMQNQLLKDSDAMGMWHSVEIRVPFLDREFMENIAAIAEDVRFADKIPKNLLIAAFSDLLPREISHRPKQGFTFPLGLWLRNGGREIFSADSNREYKRLWNNFCKGQIHFSQVWSAAILPKFQ